MSDSPTPPNGNVEPPFDPTTVQPVVPPPVAANVPPHFEVSNVPPPVETDTYVVADSWYRRPGVLAGIALGVITLIVIGLIIFFVSSDDDETVVTDSAASMQVTITRTTDDGTTPFATLQTAIVTGPTDTPDGFVWLSPPNAIAPDPATAVTDGNGDVLFRWAPREELIDSAGWRSTLVVSEILAPGVTLGATNFNCLLERPGESTRGVPMTAEISTALITEEREVRYSFAGHEFAPGDRMSCEIANAQFVPSSTSAPETTVPEATTSVVETTTTLAATTTVAPTTQAPTTAAPTTAAPVTAAPTTAAPTTVPATTAMTIIDGRSDLTTFRNLIDRAGLRVQLSNPAVKTTILAPNNDAIAQFVGTAGAPDLNDVGNARAFVLSHVLTGEVLMSSDLAARADITLDEGPARTIDAATSPITINGASVIAADDAADVSVIHTLGRALPDPTA